MAVKGLAENRGDIKQLEGKLQGYSRLRVSGHRVIFRERSDHGERIIDCIFAEKRAIVYDLFIKLAAESLGK
jgi:mRNA-degrading endonuclease RelE of RelBE toxin-antitoxin system